MRLTGTHASKQEEQAAPKLFKTILTRMDPLVHFATQPNLAGSLNHSQELGEKLWRFHFGSEK